MSKELASLMKDAARLTADAADAAAEGDIDGALGFQSEVERIMGRVRKLTTPRKTSLRRVREPSVRERAIVALTELNVPSAPREIAAFISAKHGGEFDVRALASIRRDEYRAWQTRSKREAFLVPALEGPWFVAGRGRFALSHWPLWQRIIGPLTTRADHLRLTLSLADAVASALSADARDPGRPSRMRALLAVYARSIPDAIEDAWCDAAELNMERVQRAAQSELDLIGREDERMRRAQAERAARSLNEEQQLWGGQMPQIVSKSHASG